jgi:hypothetical protein
MTMVISGAYGRDYKSKVAVEADFLADKDFVVRSEGRGYTNRADLLKLGVLEVNVRYAQDRKICVVRVR